MKKVLMLLIGIMVTVSVFAEVDFYGQVRSGMWYDMQDEDFADGNSRIDFIQSLYGNSRVGANVAADNFKAKVELGLGSSVSLRHLYGEYDFGMFNLLVGKTSTGFSDCASQTGSVVSGSDGSLIGYGVMYDGAQNMVRLSMDNGAYLSLMQPNKVDPIKVGGVDALMPKVNVGYKYNKSNLYVHPTLGVNVSKYNQTDSLDVVYDETVLSYVAAVTAKYSLGAFYVKAQGNYAQNAADYGMSGKNFERIDYVNNEILNTTTMGGYGEFGYKVNDMFTVKTGAGYVTSDRDNLDEANAGMSAFLQTAVNISENVMFVPEIGIVDNMEDEGSRMYFGTGLHVTFATK